MSALRPGRITATQQAKGCDVVNLEEVTAESRAILQAKAESLADDLARTLGELRGLDHPPVVSVEVPGTLRAGFDTGSGEILGWTFTPMAGAAGHFGPGTIVTDDTLRFDVSDELQAEIDDVDGPFWRAVRTELAAPAAFNGRLTVEWTE